MSTTTEPAIVVVFRKFKGDDDIIALFPTEPADGRGNCLSYQHIGQHGGAAYNLVIQTTTPATAEEYALLAKELRQIIGYVLDIRRRQPSWVRRRVAEADQR